MVDQTPDSNGQKQPALKKLTLPKASLGLGFLGTGAWGLLDFDTLKKFVSDTWRENIVQMVVAFAIAAIITRFLFRKDVEVAIEKAVLKVAGPVVEAINGIGARFAEGEQKFNILETTTKEHTKTLQEHGERITLIEQHLTPRKSDPTL